MSTFKYLPQYFSTTLNVGGGIDASQTTGIVLLSVSGVDITKPGQICISYSDPLDTGVAEWINYTSINGSNELVGVTRGCEGYSAHTHLPGAVIQFTLSATHINDLADVVNGIKAKDLVTTAGGTTTYTLTPTPAVGAYVTGQEFNIKMNATNTGASTINVSALGAKSLTKGGATALSSGDLLIDGVYTITYDGTQFQVSGISASATAAEVAAGSDNTKMVTPLAATGIDTRTATFTNKTLTSPVLGGTITRLGQTGRLLLAAGQQGLGTSHTNANNTNEQEVTGLRITLPIIAATCTLEIAFVGFLVTGAANNVARIRVGTSTTYLSNAEANNLYIGTAKTIEDATLKALLSVDLSTQTYIVFSLQADANPTSLALSASGNRTSIIYKVFG